MRIKELYNDAVQRLRAAAIHDAEIETAVLLGHLLKMNRAQLFLFCDQSVSPSVIAIFEDYLCRKLAREPVAYIIGEQEFWSLPFKVTRDVLIPRPETEFLIETLLRVMAEQRTERFGPVLDLGTGSGAIAVVLARVMPGAMVYAIDRFLPTLHVAVRNAQQHKVADRIGFIQADWRAGLCFNPVFELVVSNPPYVSREVLAKPFGRSDGALQPEVGLYEPRPALDGGLGGTEEIACLSTELCKILRPGGWFFMEIGADQADYVMNLFHSINKYECLAVYKDYAGRPRVFQAKRRELRDG